MFQKGSLQDKEEMHAIVRGYVQGVGFRATAYVSATKLGITGTVKNLPDGTVEIYAQGRREVLDAFVIKMKTHPRLKSVKSVDASYYRPRKSFEDFQILVN